MKRILFLSAMAMLVLPTVVSADELIGGAIGSGNGDFNYDGGATGIPDTLSVTENIPRDRAFVGVGNNPGQGLDVDGWTFVRVAYNGGSNAFGLDGNFGFDDASFEAANTGSGMAFINGNVDSVVDLIADQISFAGNAGDVFDLSYLLGSDSAGGIANVTLTLDAGLGTEQVSTFAEQSRSGSARDGSNLISETYTSTAAYSTVDLTFQLGNVAGSTRALVDDVRLDVTAVPEPGAISLLGLIALGGFVRRKR